MTNDNKKDYESARGIAADIPYMAKRGAERYTFMNGADWSRQWTYTEDPVFCNIIDSYKYILGICSGEETPSGPLINKAFDALAAFEAEKEKVTKK